MAADDQKPEIEVIRYAESLSFTVRLQSDYNNVRGGLIFPPCLRVNYSVTTLRNRTSEDRITVSIQPPCFAGRFFYFSPTHGCFKTTSIAPSCTNQLWCDVILRSLERSESPSFVWKAFGVQLVPQRLLFYVGLLAPVILLFYVHKCNSWFIDNNFGDIFAFRFGLKLFTRMIKSKRSTTSL